MLKEGEKNQIWGMVGFSVLYLHILQNPLNQGLVLWLINLLSFCINPNERNIQQQQRRNRLWILNTYLCKIKCPFHKCAPKSGDNISKRLDWKLKGKGTVFGQSWTTSITTGAWKYRVRASAAPIPGISYLMIHLCHNNCSKNRFPSFPPVLGFAWKSSCLN